MRYLILSDVHGNLEALEAVVEAAKGQYDRTLCCGDLVGYGADPNAVVEWFRANCSDIIRGNHDRACTGQEDLSWFNPVARAAALWTQAELTPENTAYIRSLPMGPLTIEDFQIAHGTPADEDAYIIDPEEALPVIASLDTKLLFFGHTHIQGAYVWRKGKLKLLVGPGGKAGRHELQIDPDWVHLVNPGSVGQPRDDDPRAAFAIYDSGARTVIYHRVRYDVAEAQRKIRDAGLPSLLADRLSSGK